MKRLHNIEDRRVLMERMKADSRPRTTLSFYRYVHLDQPERTRAELYEAWSQLEVLGRTYVAKEASTPKSPCPRNGSRNSRRTSRDWVGCPTSG